MESTKDSIIEKSQRLLKELFSSDKSDFDGTSQLLSNFRLLTREKTLNSEILDQNCIERLVDYSSNYHTEAQKCLSNLILNYPRLREQLIEPYVKCVESRLESLLSTDHNSNETSTSDAQKREVLYYDLRIIFLLSALCSSSRAKIRDRLVDSILGIIDREADEFSHDNYLLVVEGLKTIFNLTLDRCVYKSLAGDVIKKLFAVVGTEKDMAISCDGESKLDLTDQLLVNLIHLLTNMPKEVYLKLSDEDAGKILNHLDYQLKTYSRHSFRDTVLPVLNVCANICKFNEEVRKRWFDEILESAKDFEKRPEEYDNLRGRLVRLMTSVDVHLKDIAAEFIYALCDGDTEKFITYTGFGNSAAFLSSRGLLSGGLRRDSSDENQSGNNTDYQLLRDKIDPITGKLETPRRNPMEGMSEEEKEYHAHELADAITKLTNLGVVKPMRLDDEGKVTDLQPGSTGETKD